MGPDRDAVNRREFLGTGALTAGGLLLGCDPAQARAPRKHHRAPRRASRTVEVVVVGGGFAGLTAARRLSQAGKSVIVLEARDRVGGRVWNHQLGHGVISEAGGTFIGPTQDRLAVLAAELKVPTFAVYDTGNSVFVSSRGRETYSDTGPTGTAPPDPLILPELTEVVAQLDQMSSSVPVDAPWEATNAPAWDRQTLQQWIDANSATPSFRELVPAATRPIFGVEPRDVSLLFTLFYIAASGDERNPGTFERNFDTRNGAQQDRFVGGSQVIALRAAHHLGSRVVLRSPVRRIVQGRHGVSAVTDRLTVHAQQAIVAVPPALCAAIVFEPGLPGARAGLQRHLPMGFLGKVAVRYDRPFWREQGLTGMALSTTGPISATFDDSPPDGNPGIVFGFIGGDALRAFLKRPHAQRRQQVIDQLAGLFPDPAGSARKPREYLEKFWPLDRFSGGGPVGVAPPGTYTTYGPSLRQPFGAVHWAGTETATYWNGYMDGAVRSGERAALEVMDLL
jgi:monoamine oxidase